MYIILYSIYVCMYSVYIVFVPFNIHVRIHSLCRIESITFHRLYTTH